MNREGFYQDCMKIEHQGRMDLWTRLQRIKREAEAELERIERDGGCAGFALRVLAIAESVDGVQDGPISIFAR